MKAFAISIMLALAGAQVWPASTMNGGIPVAQAPLPTAAPAHPPHLLQRQSDDATSLCGYVSGNGSNALTCQESNFCGFNSVYSAFGCCTAASGASLLGCDIVTKCYDSSAFGECREACQSNTMNAWCTSSAFPFCRKYTTGIFSGFDCYTEAGEVDPVLPTPLAEFSTLDFSSTGGSGSVSSTSSRASVEGSGEPVGNDAPVSATPFSETQATGSVGQTAPASTTAAGSGCHCRGAGLWPAVMSALGAAAFLF